MNIRNTLAIAFAIFPLAAMAQDIGSEKVSFRLGGFFSNVDTVVRANGTNGRVGTSIDFESQLGLKDNETSGLYDFTWRFAQNHRLGIDYYKLNRSGTTTLKATIDFGDQTFTASTNVKSNFNSDVLALTYMYSLMQDKEKELAIGFGIHNTKFEAGIGNSAGSVSVSKDANAPLPVLAIQGAARFAENWRAEARLKYLSLKIDEYDGKLTVFQAGVQYFVTKNWAIEGGYASNDYRLDVSKPSYNGSIKYKFSGPTLALIGQF